MLAMCACVCVCVCIPACVHVFVHVRVCVCQHDITRESHHRSIALNSLLCSTPKLFPCSTQVLSWGDGSSGVLGHGDEVTCQLPMKIQGLDKREVYIIAASLSHCAAVSRDGCSFTWGSGGSGRLGHGDERPRWKPTQVAALAASHVTFIACGPSASAAIDSSGALFLWGDNFCGQLFHHDASPPAQGAELEVLSPRMFGGLPQGVAVAQVALGAYHTVVIASVTCAVYAWGDNTKGQLGSGDKKAHMQPYCVTGGVDVVGPSSMQRGHSVVCGELMTAVIDIQARKHCVLQPVFSFDFSCIHRGGCSHGVWVRWGWGMT
jgi:alpha-tubulin suppressor-like RCC1 family protein